MNKWISALALASAIAIAAPQAMASPVTPGHKTAVAGTVKRVKKMKTRGAKKIQANAGFKAKRGRKKKTASRPKSSKKVASAHERLAI